MLRLRSTSSGQYKFQKVFNEGDFLASGMISIPKGKEKPSKNTHHSAMVLVRLIDRYLLLCKANVMLQSTSPPLLWIQDLNSLSLEVRYVR